MSSLDNKNLHNIVKYAPKDVAEMILRKLNPLELWKFCKEDQKVMDRCQDEDFIERYQQLWGITDGASNMVDLNKDVHFEIGVNPKLSKAEVEDVKKVLKDEVSEYLYEYTDADKETTIYKENMLELISRVLRFNDIGMTEEEIFEKLSFKDVFYSGNRVLLKIYLLGHMPYYTEGDLKYIIEQNMEYDKADLHSLAKLLNYGISFHMDLFDIDELFQRYVDDAYSFIFSLSLSNFVNLINKVDLEEWDNNIFRYLWMGMTEEENALAFMKIFLERVKLKSLLLHNLKTNRSDRKTSEKMLKVLNNINRLSFDDEECLKIILESGNFGVKAVEFVEK